MQNPISAFLEPMISKCFNKYTGVHFLANLGIVWSLSWFVSPLYAGAITFAIAVLWEVYEYFTEGYEPYGSKKNWLFDTVMDLVVSIICIGAVIY